jgi:hypothetical protein
MFEITHLYFTITIMFEITHLKCQRLSDIERRIRCVNSFHKNITKQFSHYLLQMQERMISHYIFFFLENKQKLNFFFSIEQIYCTRLYHYLRKPTPSITDNISAISLGFIRNYACVCLIRVMHLQLNFHPI